MNQLVLPREASGGVSRIERSPLPKGDLWAALSKSRRTQSKLRYVYIADLSVNVQPATEMAVSEDCQVATNSMKLALWLFLAAAIVGLATFATSQVALPIIAGFLLAAACFIAASAVETYQRARG